MDSRFSLCLCHPRSQPARSDKRIPTRASRTSFTRPFPFLPGVIMVPAFDCLLSMRIPATAEQDGAVFETSRMPFESSCTVRVRLV
ncbi:uncharacterized protein LOC144145127 isoform X2 [Haemaphysalis longicornis]